MIDNYHQVDEITVEDLLEFLPGPDFPTGGVIVGSEGIRQAYSTGRGRIVLRGLAHIEELKGGRYRIVITEIPYQLNKSGLIERIAHLARTGKLDDISDLRDESDRRGMSIIIELKRSAQPKKVLNQLYKYTPLQTTFGAQMLALVDGEPRLLSLKRALGVYIEHRREVIIRRSQFELEKARARAHILEGLLVALANLDDVIQTIRQSPDADVAKERLMVRFNLSDRQAQAILDMQLRRLAALEQQKIEDEQRQILERIAYLEDLLANPKKILKVIKDGLIEVTEKYGDERRTHIAFDASEDFDEEDLVPDEAVLISITQRGYIKRVMAKAFRSQRRGGRGVTGHTTRDEDEVVMLIPARTLDTILFFSDKGKVYSEKAYQIPDADRTGKGIPIVNVLAIRPGETVTAVVPVPDFEAAEYCMMATRKGRAKRVLFSEFASVRPSGLIAISLADDDELGWVRLTRGDDEIVMVTEKGQALRFSESEVRSMGRTAAGVIGIRLSKGDQVTSMEVVEPGGELLVVTTKGYGKRTPLNAYAAKSRATKGITTIDKKAFNKIGVIAAARVVQEADDLTMMSAGGVIIRTKVKTISRSGRATRGVLLMNVKEGDSVASLARIAHADLLRVGMTEEDQKVEDAG
jgi:DNA gyrase subunit A